jgi:hypothetical protein
MDARARGARSHGWVASRELLSQLGAVGAPYATCSSFPVEVGLVVMSSAIEASLR